MNRINFRKVKKVKNKITLKEGLLCGSCSQQEKITSTMNWGPNSSGSFIRSCFPKASITLSLDLPGQGFPPFEKISNNTTPKENTSLLVEILFLNTTSGALHLKKNTFY